MRAHDVEVPGPGGDAPDPGWLAALESLARAGMALEESLFSTVPILGEPRTQQALDAWVDDAVGVVRQLADLALEIVDRQHLLDSSPHPPTTANPPSTATPPAHRIPEPDLLVALPVGASLTGARSQDSGLPGERSTP